jgi:hypothetical protein
MKRKQQKQIIHKRSKNMDYKLIVPVKKVDGSEIKNVTIKESFTGRDIRAIANCKGEGDAMIALVAAAADLSENTVLNMDARDIKAISGYARPFLNGGED